jgi:hypothetical protein
MTAKTEIRGPWPGSPKAKTKSKAGIKRSRVVPLELLSITDDPPPVNHAKPGGHYSTLFARLQPGQRIVCPPDRARAIGASLKDWLQKRGVSAHVQTCTRYEKDGMGGVWYYPEDKR